MVEWLECNRCGNLCSIRPLSAIFDPDMKKYGGVWYCKTCKKYYTNYFLSYEQIQELIKKNIPVENINNKENNKNE